MFSANRSGKLYNDFPFNFNCNVRTNQGGVNGVKLKNFLKFGLVVYSSVVQLDGFPMNRSKKGAVHEARLLIHEMLEGINVRLQQGLLGKG